MCYFSKYFLHCVILLIFFVATLKKKTRKNHGLSATWLQVVHVKMLKDSTVLNSFSFDSILVGPCLVDGLLSAMNFKFQRAEYALTVLILHLVDDPFSTDFIIIIYCSAL
jgi:hypothetical protein